MRKKREDEEEGDDGEGSDQAYCTASNVLHGNGLRFGGEKMCLSTCKRKR